ncbi:MAG: Trigger factor [Tenericutes bacterium ADurb.Bin087]|nr:MAG: Trigger factor [Tenericutes bacterium ADurb.Bin087]
MKLKVTKLETSKYELEVEVGENKWVEARTKAFKKLAKDVTVQGFRKGKAPEHLVRAKIDPVKELDEAVHTLLDEAFQFAVNESGHYPVMQPSYDVVKVSDTELTLKFTIVAAPVVTLGQYEGLKIGRGEVDVDDAAVEVRLNDLREQNAELVLKEDAAALGDTVVLDFEGFVDGEAFDGGKASNHELELGSGQFIPGFEDALVGVKAGESRDVNVTFPDNYHEHLAGKKAVFKTTVHEVKAKRLPALTDDFAAALNMPNVTDVASLRVHVLFELTKQAESAERNEYVEKILAKLRETSTFELASDIVNQEVKHMDERLKNQVKQQGMEWSKYLELTNQTDAEINTRFISEATVNLQNFLILNEIAKIKEIEVSDAEVDFEIAMMAQQYNMEEKRIREILGENIKNLKNDIRQKRIMDYLIEHNE